MEYVNIDESNKDLVKKLFIENWGAPIIVSRGRIHNSEELSGFIAISDNSVKGLITYIIDDSQCEIVSLDSFEENQGIGTTLINKVIETADMNKCKRVWLVTTNDNTNAIRFYQKRGFYISNIYLNAVKRSRELKPEIPLKGFDDIPILHEIEFELIIQNG